MGINRSEVDERLFNDGLKILFSSGSNDFTSGLFWRWVSGGTLASLAQYCWAEGRPSPEDVARAVHFVGHQKLDKGGEWLDEMHRRFMPPSVIITSENMSRSIGIATGIFRIAKMGSGFNFVDAKIPSLIADMGMAHCADMLKWPALGLLSNEVKEWVSKTNASNSEGSNPLYQALWTICKRGENGGSPNQIGTMITKEIILAVFPRIKGDLLLRVVRVMAEVSDQHLQTSSTPH